MKVSLFLGIFALYLLTLDINTTVSTCSANRNLSTCHSVLLSPDAELIQYGHQRLPTFREAVFHLWRDLWVLGADDQPVSFQFFQVGAERFIRDAFQIPFQLVEPHGLKLHQAVENDHLMLAGDQRKGVGETGILKIGIFDVIPYHSTFSEDSTCLN